MHTEVVLGYGKVFVSAIHQEQKDGSWRHGIMMRMHELPHPIGSNDPEHVIGKAIEHRDSDVVIWADNLDGARILQDNVNTLCLYLSGRCVDDDEDNTKLKLMQQGSV